MITLGIRDVDIDHPGTTDKFFWHSYMTWKDLARGLEPVIKRHKMEMEVKQVIKVLQEKNCFLYRKEFGSILLEIEILSCDTTY